MVNTGQFERARQYQDRQWDAVSFTLRVSRLAVESEPGLALYCNCNEHKTRVRPAGVAPIVGGYLVAARVGNGGVSVRRFRRTSISMPRAIRNSRSSSARTRGIFSATEESANIPTTRTVRMARSRVKTKESAAKVQRSTKRQRTRNRPGPAGSYQTRPALRSYRIPR
jgi:hypothetical protein